jgi:hypothetical protein
MEAPSRLRRRETAPGEPGPGEHLGRQIGGMLSDPRLRPPEHPLDVPIVDDRERIGVHRGDELRVGPGRTITPHTL